MPEEKKTAEKPAVAEKAAKTVVKISTALIENRLVAELARPDLITKVNAMPQSCNFRVHWLGKDQREIESRFISVTEQDDGKLKIVDKTGGIKKRMEDRIIDGPKPKEIKPIFNEEKALPAAEADNP